MARQDNSEEIKLISLVHSTLKTEKGIELLALLEEMYCNRPLFTADANAVYYNIGKSDLIKELRSYINTTELPISHHEETDDE